MGDSISLRDVDADGVGLLHNLQALTFLLSVKSLILQ